MNLEQRVVVFMDVLGARNAIMNGDQSLMAEVDPKNWTSE